MSSHVTLSNACAGYKPINSKKSGGSKKGAKKIDWTTGVKALVKIAIQKMMEREPMVYRTRNFGGQKPIRSMYLLIVADYPDIHYELLHSRGPDYPPRTEKEMLNVLYNRGHKGFFWNDGKKVPYSDTGRPRISPEHYSRSTKLCIRQDEAVALFGHLWGLKPSLKK